MGMFDEIICDYALPDTHERSEVFQTKSLESAVLHYTISVEGRPIWHHVRYQEVPEEERPYYGKPEWQHSFLRLAGSMRTIPEADVEVDFHGDLIMYRNERTYRVRFTEGRVLWVRRMDTP